MVQNRRFEEKSKAFNFGVRHLQCFLIFCGLSIAFAMRVNFSVAIVAITEKQSNSTNAEEVWTEKTKSYLLSSFFWGYFLTQIPAGQLARKFGGKLAFLLALFISSLFTILTPFFAEIGNWQLLCIVRLIMGVSQGVIFPTTHTLLSKWAPLEERGTLGTYCYAGTQFGTIVMLAVSGVLAASSFGWPSIFYIPGAIGLLWSAAWLYWGASTPNDYKSITDDEKSFIESSLAQKSDNEEEKQHLKVPWTKILTSVPFLALTIVHSANNWGFWTLLTQIPSYMKNILGMDIKSNALLSALPYCAMFLLSFVFTTMSTIFTQRKCMQLTTSRKFFNTIGQWIPMISIIALGYVNSSQTVLAVVLLTITVGVNAAVYLGFVVNHIDLSPNFAGIMMGMTNSLANIMSLIAPLVVGLVVNNEKDPDQWRIIFFIAGGFYLVGNLLFLAFGSAEVQPWNNPQHKDDTKSLDYHQIESPKGVSDLSDT